MDRGSKNSGEKQPQPGRELGEWFHLDWDITTSPTSPNEPDNSRTISLTDTELSLKPIEGWSHSQKSTEYELKCPSCNVVLQASATFCSECGYLVEQKPEAVAGSSGLFEPGQVLREHYRLDKELTIHPAFTLWSGSDTSLSDKSYLVLVVPDTEKSEEKEEAADTAEQVSLHEQSLSSDATLVMSQIRKNWLTADEVSKLLELMPDALPRLIEAFATDTAQVFILNEPVGKSLWQAWNQSAKRNRSGYRLLGQLAGFLHQLHSQTLVTEDLTPDDFVVIDKDRLIFLGWSKLLPLPIAENEQLKHSLYSAPERMLAPGKLDFRADLYTFGAIVYSLYLGRLLKEDDFEAPGVVKPFAHIFPVADPFLTQLVYQTFQRHPGHRLASKDASKSDTSGFQFLLNMLDAAQSQPSALKLEVTSATCTGVIRSLNEDAVRVLRSTDAALNSIDEQAVIVLTDGMGGYEAGEEACQIAIAAILKYLATVPPFAKVIRQEIVEGEYSDATIQESLSSALQKANNAIFDKANDGEPMGCTCELMWLQHDTLYLGHIGDSRTYRYSGGVLESLTKDHTMVERMVQMGYLTREEAQYHPKRHELQQALGGTRHISPDLSITNLNCGDVLLCCSDGLTNHVRPMELEHVLSQPSSAEEMSRTLINLAIHGGGSDNISLVIIKVV